MNRELPKVYEPQEVEGRVYRAWEENGCFRGVRDPEKKQIGRASCRERVSAWG